MTSVIWRRPTASWASLAEGVLSVEVALLTLTVGPAGRASRAARFSDTELRLAPVSTTNWNGPWPLTVTGTVMRGRMSEEPSITRSGLAAAGFSGAGPTAWLRAEPPGRAARPRTRIAIRLL